MLNARGGIECDFTVTRLAEDRFRIVTGTAFGQHDLAWLRQHAPEDGSVQVADVTSRVRVLRALGARARATILSRSRPPTSRTTAFPYMTAQELAVGRVPCLALRVTYVGELGWELYCPAELGLALWDTLWEAGREHGLVAGGYKAIDSLRLEKGYRVWGADITPEETPYEAGLGFAVKLDKVDFIGRDASADDDEPDAAASLPDTERPAGDRSRLRARAGRRRGRRPRDERRLRLHGREVDRVRLPACGVDVGTGVEVEIFGERVPGEVAAEPLYDPAGERIRA